MPRIYHPSPNCPCLLDMPAPERTVLIEVIRGLPPLAQENA